MDHDVNAKAPIQIGPFKDLTITGKLFPSYANGRPVLLNMSGVSDDVVYLPLFDDPDKLSDTLAKAGVEFDKVRQVNDGEEFLNVLPLHIIIIAGLRFTDSGKIRFHQVQRPIIH